MSTEDHVRLARAEDARRAWAEEGGSLSGDGRPAAIRLEGLTGEVLISMLERDDPPRIIAGTPIAGHLQLLVAPPFAGKSTLMLWTALAQVAGVAPWEGASDPEQGAVLILAPDEGAAQLVRRMRSLMVFHPARQVATLEEILRSGELEILAPDHETPGDALDLCRFDDRGLAALGRRLETDKALVHVYCDAWADLLPVGTSENDNERASVIGRSLERMAVESGVGITVLHHAVRDRTGLASAETRPRDLARGASALAAKARAVTGIYAVSGLDHARTLWCETNLGPPPRKLTLAVAGSSCEPGEILHWQVEDLSETYRVEDYLQPNETIPSVAELARRLAGMDEGDGKKSQVPGSLRTRAKEIAENWEDMGFVKLDRSAAGKGCPITRVR